MDDKAREIVDRFVADPGKVEELRDQRDDLFKALAPLAQSDTRGGFFVVRETVDEDTVYLAIGLGLLGFFAFNEMRAGAPPVPRGVPTGAPAGPGAGTPAPVPGAVPPAQPSESGWWGPTRQQLYEWVDAHYRNRDTATPENINYWVQRILEKPGDAGYWNQRMAQ